MSQLQGGVGPTDPVPHLDAGGLCSPRQPLLGPAPPSRHPEFYLSNKEPEPIFTKNTSGLSAKDASVGVH